MPDRYAARQHLGWKTAPCPVCGADANVERYVVKADETRPTEAYAAIYEHVRVEGRANLDDCVQFPDGRTIKLSDWPVAG